MIFLSAALAHLLAVISPGPDTAIILHQSLNKGRQAGLMTAVGIGCGILLHCIAAISGITLLLYSTEQSRLVIELLGASYLMYLGISYFRVSPSSSNPALSIRINTPFVVGLVTNLLNIKAFLFMAALFSFLQLTLDSAMVVAYVLYFPISTAAWFSFLSYALTHEKVSAVVTAYSNKIEVVTSIFLITLGLIIIMQSLWNFLNS